MEVVLGVTGHASEADEWTLVLAAAGVPYRVVADAGAWRLVVAEGDAARARAALDAYGHDQRRRPPAPLAVPEYGPTSVGIVLALVLVAAYVVTGPRAVRGSWFTAGTAVASRVRAGEPWRAVTALTLHADAAHLAGNVAGTVVFVSAVGRVLGPGVACGLVVLAGVAGNLANAVLHADGHASVGASTAVFGAVGILGGLAAVRRRRSVRRWVPIAGSLALLAMLGSEARSDLGAHAFGLLAGVVLGLAAGSVAPAPPGRALQWGAAVAGAVVVVGAWRLALG